MTKGTFRYLLIVFGFLLFLISFVVSFETIDRSSLLLSEIKDKHFKFFTITENIRSEIQKHESEIYLYLIYQHDFKKKFPYGTLSQLDKPIKSLLELSSDLEIGQAFAILSSLQKKIIEYQIFEKSLLKDFPKANLAASSTELMQFKLYISTMNDNLSQLTYLAKRSFLNGVNNLMHTIEYSKKNTLFILVGGIFTLLFAFMSLIRHNKKYALQLERALEAERRQKELQNEVLLHSSTLEKEVAKKTLEVSHRYYHNSLTNLPNRLKLMECIEAANEPKLALFDIDKFQRFNDYFGAKRGDNAIIFLANKLNYLVDEPLMLFHLSGDAFAIFCDDALTKDAFLDRTKNIFDQVKSFEVIESQNRLILNITAGFALNKEGLFAKADIALKRAKQEHREYQLYDDKKRIRDNFLKHLNQLRELTRAISDDDIEIYLQPICDAKTKKREKFEVLARIRDSQGKILLPLEFLQVAKEAKLYPKITQIIFTKTMKLINTGKVKCSVNISIDDILNKKTRFMLMEGLRSSDYAEHLTFELLESEDIEKYDKVQLFISDIRSFGAKLAIDDFGTGYSNFDHLMHLDANFVKIDGSLIKGLEDDLLSQNFVKAMVQFAKELGIKTIAEYVSNENIYNELLNYGVDYVQGFWLGKPEPVEYYLKEEL